MNCLALNPSLYPGVQQTTITNANRSKEFIELQLVGNVLAGLPAETDAYVDVYVGYKTPKNLRRIMTKGGTTNGHRTIRIEQADTYIVESLNFQGYLLGDFGNTDSTLLTTVLSGSAAIAAPDLNFKRLLQAHDHAGDQLGSIIDMGAVNGRLCLLVVNIETETLTGPIAVTLAEFTSDAGAGSSAITLTESPDNSVPISAIESDTGTVLYAFFQRTKQYMRATLNVTGSDACGCAISVAELPA